MSGLKHVAQSAYIKGHSQTRQTHNKTNQKTLNTMETHRTRICKRVTTNTRRTSLVYLLLFY